MTSELKKTNLINLSSDNLALHSYYPKGMKCTTN